MVVIIVSFSRGLMVERKRRRRAKPEHLCCGIGAGWLGGGGEKRTDRDEGGGILAPFTLSGNWAAVCGRIKNRPTLKTHRPSEGSRYFSEHRLREQRNFLNSPDRIFGNQSRLSARAA